MKVYVDEMPKSCYECEFCGKLKPPAKRPEIECMRCNMMKRLDRVSDFCILKTIQSLQYEKAIKALERVNGILADAIIEITEPLEVLNFQDLEKIARCFENKIDQLIKWLKGDN